MHNYSSYAHAAWSICYIAWHNDSRGFFFHERVNTRFSLRGEALCNKGERQGEARGPHQPLQKHLTTGSRSLRLHNHNVLRPNSRGLMRMSEDSHRTYALCIQIKYATKLTKYPKEYNISISIRTKLQGSFSWTRGSALVLAMYLQVPCQT